MDKLIITGSTQLAGEINISAAKNAYLPLMAAVLLNENPVHFKRLPKLRDIATMKKLLASFGVKITENKINEITTFDAGDLTSHEANYELVKTMRASIFVLGPLLTRLKKAKVSLPGGCAIGARPIDIHLEGLKKFGANIELEAGYVIAAATKLNGNHITLPFPSVGATENILMAAVLACGETVIENCAMEPEIDDLANFLIKAGANITGIGTKTLKICGVKALKEVEYEAIGDRIEGTTYLLAGLATQSQIKVNGLKAKSIEYVLEVLKGAGAKIEVSEDAIEVFPSKMRSFAVDTAPFPGFPTDIQAQMMALACTVEGTSIITENIFENRFMHVPELQRLGADITLKGRSAIIKGGGVLNAAPVMCTDLRASAALVIAALAAKGETEIGRVYHLERGYEDLDGKLKNIGAKIERFS